jgi:hypothetical protein
MRHWQAGFDEMGSIERVVMRDFAMRLWIAIVVEMEMICSSWWKALLVGGVGMVAV